MPFRWNLREHLALATLFLRWLLISLPLGLLVGSAVALFLWALDLATTLRWQTLTPNSLPWLLYLLPLAGIAITSMYAAFGKTVEAGNNLIIDQIHEPGGGVPLRMTPLVLLGTVITHLFGGSAGREGTAVQMGGSLASYLAYWMRLRAVDLQTVLMMGMAGGFGAVFGTPLAGAMFAVEVQSIGLVRYGSLVPCLMASIIGDIACRMWGTHHTAYHPVTLDEPLSALLALKAALAGIAFGLASVLFAELTHGLSSLFKKIPQRLFLLRPVIGAFAIIALALLLGRDYLGLGVTSPIKGDITILSAFTPNGAHPLSWLWKILFTAITLSSGFKGGEVTPLFFIGATLGNLASKLLHAPTPLFAALGFVGVFAGATNTPIACTLMGVELFGSGATLYMAIACFTAYLFSGHNGIYLSQRIGTPKLLSLDTTPHSLRSWRNR